MREIANVDFKCGQYEFTKEHFAAIIELQGKKIPIRIDMDADMELIPESLVNLNAPEAIFNWSLEDAIFEFAEWRHMSFKKLLAAFKKETETYGQRVSYNAADQVVLKLEVNYNQETPIHDMGMFTPEGVVISQIGGRYEMDAEFPIEVSSRGSFPISSKPVKEAIESLKTIYSYIYQIEHQRKKTLHKVA